MINTLDNFYQVVFGVYTTGLDTPAGVLVAVIIVTFAAVAVALPNLNELARDLNGKLFPVGILKLLYRLKVQGAKSARLLILGIRP